jgi:hypothetical protein
MFGDADTNSITEMKFQKLRQGNCLASTYLSEFRQSDMQPTGHEDYFIIQFR